MVGIRNVGTTLPRRLAGLFGAVAITVGVLVPLELVVATPAGATTLFQTLPAATVGVPYSAQLTYSDSSGGPYTFSTNPTQGILPPGLTLNSSGLVSGTPEEQADVPIQSYFYALIEDQGSNGVTNGEIDVDITVSPTSWTPPPPLQITTTSVPEATVSNPYSTTIQATGGVPSDNSWSLGGSLPQGFSFSNGTISGTTTDVGSFNVTVLLSYLYTPDDGGATLGSRQEVVTYQQSTSQAYVLNVTSGNATLDPLLVQLQTTLASLQGEVGTVTGLVASLEDIVQPLLQGGCLEAALGTLLQGTPPEPGC